MKNWWQSKIIWACIVAFVTALGAVAQSYPPLDWQALLGAVFALVVGIFRAFSTSTSIK